MIIVTLFYLASCAVAFLAAALLHETDRRHAKQVAMALTFVCCISNATWITENWWTWGALHAAVAWFVAVRHRLRPAPWKLTITSLATADAALDLWWHFGDKSNAASYIYTAALNAIFLAQLACVALSGSRRIGDVVRDVVGGWNRLGDGRGVAVLLWRAAVRGSQALGAAWR